MMIKLFYLKHFFLTIKMSKIIKLDKNILDTIIYPPSVVREDGNIIVIFYSDKYDFNKDRKNFFNFLSIQNYSLSNDDTTKIWDMIYTNSKYPFLFLSQKNYQEINFNYDLEMIFLNTKNIDQDLIYRKEIKCFEDLMSFTTLTNIFSINHLKNFIYDNRYHYVLTYTGASWCPPCRKILFDLNYIETRFPKVKFVKIDFDFSKELVSKYHGENKIPFFMFFNHKSMDIKKSIQTSDKNVLINSLERWIFDLGNKNIFSDENF